MDWVSIIIIGLVVIVAVAIPWVIGSFRSLDRRAEDLEGTDRETAQALRDARKNIDRGRGLYGP